MTKNIRVPSSRAVGRRKTPKAVPILPEAVKVRTDRLVEIADHCRDAKRIADEIGEGFLAFLLSMAIEETQMTMRRATVRPLHRVRKKRSSDMSP